MASVASVIDVSAGSPCAGGARPRHYGLHSVRGEVRRHPPREPAAALLQQVVDALRDDALIAYPTDSGYALGCRIGNRDGRDRILRIRGLDERHHFTLVCKDFSHSASSPTSTTRRSGDPGRDPGPVHVHPAGHPGGAARLLHPKKRTVGVRIPDHTVAQALLDLLGEPLLSSTLILPGETGPRTLGWDVKEELDHAVELVIEAGETPAEQTTVIDWSEGAPVGAAGTARATPSRFVA